MKCDTAEKQPVLKVVDDPIGSPTCAVEVSEAICQMLRMEAFPEGLYHLAARGYVSRYEVARTLLTMLGKKADVVPCKTAEFKTAQQPF